VAKGHRGSQALPTNPGTEPQQVLDAVLSVSAAEWDRFWSVFLELVTFSPWLEMILGIEGLRSQLIADEIQKHFP
jgi:hypothetical protein